MNFGKENLIVAVSLTSLLDSMHPGKNEKQTKPFEINVQTFINLLGLKINVTLSHKKYVLVHVRSLKKTQLEILHWSESC